MKSLTNLSAVFLLQIFLMHGIPSIAGESAKKGHLEIGVGVNMLGPVNQMNDLMVQYHFDATTNNWFFGGSSVHPHYASVGFSSHLAYSRDLREKAQAGVMLGYSNLREIYGASSDGGFLFVQFSSVDLVPFYAVQFAKSLEGMVGPVVQINNGKKTSGGGGDNYTKMSPGLLVGFNLFLWKCQGTFGKLGIHYTVMPKSRMGPYTASSFSNSFLIPENKFAFSHLDFSFVFGLNLK